MKDSVEKNVNFIAANEILDKVLSSGAGKFLSVQSTARLANSEFDYTYTIGRTEQRLPEVIFTVPLKEGIASALMIAAIEEFPPEKHGTDFAFILSMADIPQHVRRFRWMKLDIKTLGFVRDDLMPLLAERYSEELCKKIEVYQLLFADKNNRLPYEKQYLVDTDQVVLVAS